MTRLARLDYFSEALEQKLWFNIDPKLKGFLHPWCAINLLIIVNSLKRYKDAVKSSSFPSKELLNEMDEIEFEKFKSKIWDISIIYR